MKVAIVLLLAIPAVLLLLSHRARADEPVEAILIDPGASGTVRCGHSSGCVLLNRDGLVRLIEQARAACRGSV